MICQEPAVEFNSMYRKALRVFRGCNRTSQLAIAKRWLILAEKNGLLSLDQCVRVHKWNNERLVRCSMKNRKGMRFVRYGL